MTTNTVQLKVMSDIEAAPPHDAQSRSSCDAADSAASEQTPLAVRAGEWGGSGPGPTSSSVIGGGSSTNLPHVDAGPPPAAAFDSIRAFDLAGGGYKEDGSRRSGGDEDEYSVRRSRFKRVVTVLLIAVGIVGVVTVVEGTRNGDNNTTKEAPAADNGNTAETSSSSTPPKQNPTNPQVNVPAGSSAALEPIVKLAIESGITPDVSTFDVQSSPQSRAASWVASQHPDGPNALIMQRYGIATFWLATMPVFGEGVHSDDARTDGDKLGDGDICEWYGVTCNNGSGWVSEINLAGIGLDGTLPYELFASTKDRLQLLDLSGNPNLSGSLPDSIGSMKMLTTLYLQGNSLESTIPFEIFGLPALTDLNLSQNMFEGPIKTPDDGPYAPLKEIVLHDNWLTGSPDSLGNLAATLVTLDINSNNLSGQIPTSFWGLSNLSYLRLSHNHLSGAISSEIGRLTGLRFISLDRNELLGSIPKQIGDLAQLEALFLHDNFISGSVPEDIGDLSELESLVIENNDMTGSLPDSIGNLKNLNRLAVSNCGLSGPIPPSIGGASNLKEFSGQNNAFIGDIPSEIADCLELESLTLQDNHLGGTVPKELGDLKKLRVLRLEGNGITGEVPELVCRLTYEGDLVDFVTDCSEVMCSCCTEDCL